MAEGNLAWRCPVCRVSVSTPFCPTCGESPPDQRDLTLHGLLRELVIVFTNIDSKVIRSFRTLMTRPGELTVAFMEGRRKEFIGPFPIFLTANVLFFAMQSLTGFRVFSSALELHLHDQMWSELAQTLVAGHLTAMKTSLELYAPVFDQAVSVNSKSLIGPLMVPPFALLLPAVFLRSGRPFGAHLVFALHFYAFLLVLLSVPLAGLALNSLFGGSGIMSETTDHAWSIVILLIGVAYLYRAVGPVYGSRGAVRVFQAATLTFVAACLHFWYRFTLFLITLYTT